MSRSAGSEMNESGFTATELLVSVAILIILAAIAIPAFSMWMPQFRLKQAARDLYSTMQSMKMTAVKNNENTSVVFSTAPDQYQYTLSGVSKTVVLSDYGSGVKFDDPGHTLTFSTSPVTFDGRGFCNSADIYLSNQNNSGYFLVKLLPSGAIDLQEYQGGIFQ
jgi:type IV fimbrial biogenesis protein FimT